MRFFGYPYNDLVICKDSPDYLGPPYKVTISNTRATFAYYSFCDNLRLQCTLRLLSLFAVIFKLISSEKK